MCLLVGTVGTDAWVTLGGGRGWIIPERLSEEFRVSCRIRYFFVPGDLRRPFLSYSFPVLFFCSFISSHTQTRQQGYFISRHSGLLPLTSFRWPNSLRKWFDELGDTTRLFTSSSLATTSPRPHLPRQLCSMAPKNFRERRPQSIGAVLALDPCSILTRRCSQKE